MPNIIVKNNLFLKFLKLLFIIQWWHQVIENPEDNKIIEFNKGISYGLKVMIFIGGHIWPISIFGAIDLWMKVQKNEMKKNNSDVINKIILNFKNFIIKNVWFPWKVLSRITSRHHRIIEIIMFKKLIIINIYIYI